MLVPKTARARARARARAHAHAHLFLALALTALPTLPLPLPLVLSLLPFLPYPSYSCPNGFRSFWAWPLHHNVMGEKSVGLLSSCAHHGDLGESQCHLKSCFEHLKT